MKTETKHLAALVQLALQKKTFIPVSYIEITSALNALKIALEILPFCDQSFQDVDASLQHAADVLSGLAYLMSTRTILIDNNSRRTLLDQIGKLHKKVIFCLQQYGDPQTIQYDLLSVNALAKTLSGIDKDLQSNTSTTQLYELIRPHLLQVQSLKTMHYHHWLWWSKFAASCEASIMDLPSFSDILIRLNFNLPCFIHWLSDTLVREIEAASTISEKLQVVTAQILRYKSFHSVTDGFIRGERSVKHAIITICKAKLLCLTKQPLSEQNYPKPSLPKISTVLSVPQLALLLRLMIETKMINENNQSSVLKNVAAVVSTSKTSAISFESLRVNYYTPNIATKNIVKEYLLQMLRLVNNY